MNDEMQPEPGTNRTELAEDRTILANERTFAGWMRTSMAAVAIGLGFVALFRAMEPEWIAKTIATSFLLLAILIIILAERRAAAVISRLDQHVVKSANRMNLRIFAAVVSIATLGLIVTLWMLDF